MDKKEFLLPGTVLGIVIVLALAILLTHPNKPGTFGGDAGTASSTASSSMASSTGGTGSGMGSGTKPSSTGMGTGGNTQPMSYYPYGTVVLALNQAAGFRDGLSVRVVAVAEDSRCPSGVQCIQAGTVRVTLKGDVNGIDSTHEVALGKSVSINGDTFTFASVSPAHPKDGIVALSAYRFTFTVTRTGSVATSAPCYVGGCSSEVCSDTPNAASACLYREEYACYRGATCERQSSGACGWTQTPGLQQCLASTGT